MVYKNRDQTLRFRLWSSVDLTGAKIWFSVKSTGKGVEDDDASIEKRSANNGGDDSQAKVITGWAQDSETGCYYSVLEVYIKQVDTINMEVGDYVYDVVVENSSGRKLQAVEPAPFMVKQPVTLALSVP